MPVPDCIPPTGAPLVGRTVRLDPMRQSDAAALFPVYADPRCYQEGFIMFEPHRSVADTEALVSDSIAALGSGRTAYTVRLVADSGLGAAGTVVGSSSLGDVDVVRQHVHLGWTMYGSRWWGTVVNPEAKLLLLEHAFDTCGFGRVKIQTDVINARSRAAIVKLGATFEGVTRRDSRRADRSWRDSAVHSILIDEWPMVRRRLLTRLAVSGDADRGD